MTGTLSKIELSPKPPLKPRKSIVELTPLRHDNPELYGTKEIVGSVNYLEKSPPRRLSLLGTLPLENHMTRTNMVRTSMMGTKKLRIMKFRSTGGSPEITSFQKNSRTLIR
jgi:hypothetical protein